MNELFVNVKVDREERPDVDAQYMVLHVAAALHTVNRSSLCRRQREVADGR